MKTEFRNDVSPDNVVDHDGRHVHRVELVLAVAVEIQGDLFILDQQDKLLAAKSGKSYFFVVVLVVYMYRLLNFFAARFLRTFFIQKTFLICQKSTIVVMLSTTFHLSLPEH